MTTAKFKNIFVLCTGRCGSVTFAKACSHFSNYSSGHESRSRSIGPHRLAYPLHHIEADNRLSWLLGRLEQEFGDDAYYVHLKRDPDQVALSYNKRWDTKVGILSGYNNHIHFQRHPHPIAARDMVETITQNIDLFLKDKTHKCQIDIENPHNQFIQFANDIGVEGNINAALEEFSLRHNPSPVAGNEIKSQLKRIVFLVEDINRIGGIQQRTRSIIENSLGRDALYMSGRRRQPQGKR